MSTGGTIGVRFQFIVHALDCPETWFGTLKPTELFKGPTVAGNTGRAEGGIPPGPHKWSGCSDGVPLGPRPDTD
jgi:hypothetical protein